MVPLQRHEFMLHKDGRLLVGFGFSLEDQYFIVGLFCLIYVFNWGVKNEQ